MINQHLINERKRYTLQLSMYKQWVTETELRLERIKKMIREEQEGE